MAVVVLRPNNILPRYWTNLLGLVSGNRASSASSSASSPVRPRLVPQRPNHSKAHHVIAPGVPPPAFALSAATVLLDVMRRGAHKTRRWTDLGSQVGLDAGRAVIGAVLNPAEGFFLQKINKRANRIISTADSIALQCCVRRRV